jgi:hypothetical protein
MDLEPAAGRIAHVCRRIGCVPMAGMLTAPSEATTSGIALDLQAAISSVGILQISCNHYATIMQLSGKYQGTSQAIARALQRASGAQRGLQRAFAAGSSTNECHEYELARASLGKSLLAVACVGRE